jgi:hypothetical protein
MDKPTLASVLMGVEDDPITKRGMLWPRVERQSGKAELGWPSFLHEPWEALKRLQSGSYRPGQPDAGWWDDQGAGDAATLAGALITGGLGLNWAGVIPKGAVGSAGAKLPTQKGITAYHGSPHDFDKFDMSKIGSGEGAQAYGHGLYFAEKEGVAKGYRDKLTDGASFIRPDGSHWDPGTLQHLNVRVTARRDGIDAAIAKAKELSAPPYTPATVLAGKDLAALEKLQATGGVKPNPGRLYEVRINADPDQFLDWDAPLSKQPPKVAEAMRGAFRDLNFEIPDNIVQLPNGRFAPAVGDRVVGRPDGWPDRGTAEAVQKTIAQEAAKNANANAGDLMSRTYGGQTKEAKSNALRDSGIPGIKYLDQGSRAGGEGTRNYVVFDADKIEILKKYGWVPAGVVGGGMMMTPPDGQEGF